MDRGCSWGCPPRTPRLSRVACDLPGVRALNVQLTVFPLPCSQIEFYFSDSNLYRDEFLHDLITGDPAGFVDIATLCMFNRIKQLLNLSSRTPGDVSEGALETVATALEGSSELVVSEDRKRVKRARALVEDPTEVAKEIDERSLVVGPFRFDIHLEELQSYLETLGEVKSVRMRRHMHSKDFRGSVFVEFASIEEAERVLKKSKKDEGGEGFVYDGAPLEMEMKVGFLERKAAERQARHERRDNHDKRRRDGDQRNNHGEHDHVDIAPKEVKDEDVDMEIGQGGMLVRFKFALSEEEKDKLQAVSFGLVKDSLGGRDAGLEYVEYKTGGAAGCARFNSADAAKAAISNAADGKLMIAGFEAHAEILKGDEEREYVRHMLEERQRSAAERANRKAQDRKQGGRGGRGRGGRNSGHHKRQRKM